MRMIEYFQRTGLSFEIKNGRYELKESCPLCGKVGFAIDSGVDVDLGYCLSCDFVGDIYHFEAKKSGITVEEAKSRLADGEVISISDKLSSVAEKKKQSEILNAIQEIPNGEKVLASKLKPILSLIALRPQSETEDYFRFLRSRFPDITHQQILDFRSQLKELRYAIKKLEAKKKVEAKPEIPEDIKKEAEEFLRDPNIIPKIQSLLSDVGIVGEEHNRIALWLMFLSRKLSTQIHACVLGQSSSGKSELVKKVLSTVPEDEVIEFSSLTARALDYQGDNLNGKVIFLSEMAGMSEEVEYTIRICMSEQRLQRGHVIKDEVTGQMQSVAYPIEVKSVFVITTTKSKGSLDNENSTRFCEIYSDESQRQTKRVIEFIKQSHSRDYKLALKTRSRKIEILRAVQKLLEPIDVSIPYAGLLSFPDQTTRNRRDMGRFLNFLKTIAFLRRYQKEVKTDDAGTYIEADTMDYRLAYDILLPIMRNTLDDLSHRSMTVLEVCCLLQAEINLTSTHKESAAFTVKDIQNRAIEKQIDLKNTANLRQELEELVSKEYLEILSGDFGKRGSRQRFRVTAQFEIDESSETIIKVMTANMNILEPDELEGLLTKKYNN